MCIITQTACVCVRVCVRACVRVCNRESERTHKRIYLAFSHTNTFKIVRLAKMSLAFFSPERHAGGVAQIEASSATGDMSRGLMPSSLAIEHNDQTSVTDSPSKGTPK